MTGNNEDNFSDRLDEAGTSSLLAIFGHRAVNRLVEEIAVAGTEWFQSSLESVASPIVASQILSGDLDLAWINELKTLGKRLHRAGGEDVLSGFVAYFTALACGVVHFQKLLSKQKPEKVREGLLDLAAVLDEPWSGFFHRAAKQTSKSS